MEQDQTVQHIFETLCANIYKEIAWKEGVLDRQQRSRDAGEKDLYMEQCYVCGILGYHKFLSLDRLSVILGWQLQPGCYGIDKSSSDEDKESDDKIEEAWSEKQIEDTDHNSNFSTDRLQPEDFKKRRKRRLTSKLPGKLLNNEFQAKGKNEIRPYHKKFQIKTKVQQNYGFTGSKQMTFLTISPSLCMAPPTFVTYNIATINYIYSALVSIL